MSKRPSCAQCGYLLSVILMAACATEDTARPAVPLSDAQLDAYPSPTQDSALTDAHATRDASAHDTSTNDAALGEDAARDSQVAGDGAIHPLDASADAHGDAGTAQRWILGVNVHPYPKPTAYGFTAADGADRMGNALRTLNVTHVRAGSIGDTAFLERLASFGVRHTILLLTANAYGKPFDAALLEQALDRSLSKADELGMTITVEGLNEWDLFRTRSYNVGVLPAGMNDSQFIAHTQHALYVAAHARGVQVLGPSVGHGMEAASLMLFPDVSADVDIINMHQYFGTNPEALPLQQQVDRHAAFQGAGKPVWVTETGISAYNGVDANEQGDVIARGVATFRDSGLIDGLFNYELLDGQLPGWNGTTFVPDHAEYHFGLFTFAGEAKPAAHAFRDLVSQAP